MATKNIYLAGPIAGCNYDGATGWRDYATSKFAPGIKGISPMRLKEFLKNETNIGIHDYPEDLMSTATAIYVRDKYDCTHADAVIALFPKEATAVSVGTVMELGWADANNVPVIIVSEDPRIIHHPLPTGAAGWVVKNLDEAITVVNGMFGPYVR